MRKRKKLQLFLIVVILCISLIVPQNMAYAYTKTAAATNDYTTWKQTSSTWGDATPWPDASIPKFGDAGCWITSVAILLRHYNVVTDSNVNTFNPLICNNRLMQYGIVNSAGDWCNLDKMKNAYPGFEYVGTKAYSFSNLKSLYDQGYACIVHETRGHYVAVKSVSSSAVVVMDPGYATTSLTTSDSIQYFKVTPKPVTTIKLTASYSQDGISLNWEKKEGAVGYWLKRSTSENGTYTCIVETTNTSYVDKTVSPGVKYYYKVQPFSSYGLDHSNTVSYIANCKLISSYYGESSINLSWSKTADAAGYWLKRSTSENGTYTAITETTNTSFVDKNVELGGQYYYKVQPFNSKGQGMNHSNIISCKIGEFTPPTITDISVSGQNVTVKWDAVKGAAKYNLQLCNSDWSKSWWYATTGTSYTFENLADGVWQFRVGSEDSSGNCANSTRYRYISLGTPGTPNLEEPTFDGNKVSLSWNTTNSTFIKVELINDSGQSTWYENPRCPLVLEDLNAGTYKYKVQAYNTKGDMRESGYDTFVYEEFTPPTITDISVSGQNVTVKWDAVKGAAKYNLQLCNSDWSKSWWYATTGTSYTFENLADGVWQFRVGSEDSSGNCANSTRYRYISLGTPGTPNLEKPTFDGNKVSLSWNTTNSTFIKVELINDSGQSTWYENPRCPLVLENLNAGTYKYKVQAYNTKGDMRESGYEMFTIASKECEHSWNNGIISKTATCVSNGTRVFTCNKCGETKTESIPKIGHNSKTEIEKATTTKSGVSRKRCATCGTILSSTTIPAVSSMKLSYTTYTYTGGVKTPAVTVKDAKGKTLTKNVDYTVKYASGRKTVGTYKVTVNLKGKYSGSRTISFKIIPKGTYISSLTRSTKAFTVKWKKQSTQTSGYQILCSTSSRFASGNKYVTVTSNQTTAKKFTQLKAKKKYYVKVRTYKTVNGTKYYSGWSSAKAVTTK